MHPYTWSKEDVYTWLDWCRKEYALSEVPLEKFSMNGKCKLEISTKIQIIPVDLISCKNEVS